MEAGVAREKANEEWAPMRAEVICVDLKELKKGD